MKRIVIAIILGILFPILYTIIAGTLTDAFPEYFTQSVQLFGQSMPGPVLAPTMFPMYFDAWLRSKSFFGWRWLLDSTSFRVFTFVIPIIAIYSLISYGFLVLIGFPRTKQKQGIHEPPPPKP